MKKKRQAIFEIILLLSFIVLVVFAVYNGNKLNTLKEQSASRTVVGVIQIGETFQQDELRMYEYENLHNFVLDDTDQAMRDFQYISFSEKLPYLNSYFIVCRDYTYLVVNELISEDDREALRQILLQYSGRTVTDQKGENTGRTNSAHLKEMDRELQKYIESTEESRQEYEQLKYDLSTRKAP